VLLASGLEEAEFSFTAHLLPLDRGILETIYFRTTASRPEELTDLYRTRYAREPFVRVYDPGHVPDLRAVQRSNYCDLGVRLDAATGRAVVVSAIDNLVKLLVKIGGTLLDADTSRRRLAAELAAAAAGGIQLVVVHGGGKQMTRFLAERGVESRFVNGLRVTTPETLDAVLKVLAGSVNHELVAAFIAAGARAVGLSGIDACLTEAETLSPELGAVGRLVRSDPELLDLLTSRGYLPVVACVAADRQGRIYNVNADQMAAVCAAAFSADCLVFLTDVSGVLGAGHQLLPRLTIADSERLIGSGVASGGMQAKLNAAMEALRKGVREIAIAPGAEPDIIRRLLTGEPVGSRLTEEVTAHD
jgi:acetylglutamate kinase